LAHLLGKCAAQIVLRKPSIVIARDLTPSQTALMDHASVLAFCTAEGGATSHTAILAKSLGIPAIVALGETILDLPPCDFVLVDAIAGELTHQPTPEQRQIFKQRRIQAISQQEEVLKAAFEPAITRDNVCVEVFANIGSVADAQAAIAHGAEGVGLFRTEFLFLSRQSMPSVEQQIEVYRKVIDTLGGRPLVVRTLDIGGDKQVDYLGIIAEANPFLGWRGIRMISERADVLRDQLYALLTAAAGTDLRIMLPMVSQVEEVISARRLLDEALAAVRQADADFQIKLQLGIMIEVPSAALMVEHFAPHVDFFSIGTNDLTQYTLAVDRMNARVASLASPFHPAVLKLIERTVRVAHENKKWVGMCGELAGEPLAVPFLLGVGLDEFSMPPPAIPTIKHIIRQISVGACKGIAEHVLRLATTEETRDYLKSELERLITERT
ncbi:MAG: phosphoenolpyruvate--protein phosphotransferase, partial [Anaerolineaceae bacterium]|nr:phosphoenolpyruvate--protein phosphotransferase [Anaerolineaceae bacterium]